MDQKEIDALINQGSVAEFNKQQEELLKNLVETNQASQVQETPPVQETPQVQETPPVQKTPQVQEAAQAQTEDSQPKSVPEPSQAEEASEPGEKTKVPSHKKGKVMGQISRVTEESEAGTNMVMGYLENVLTVISRQQNFIKDIGTMYRENPKAIDVGEVLGFLMDNMNSIEEQIFHAMDAFQFQDIGRQKLMKVMYTLSKLNEYLNELLGSDSSDTSKVFGHTIEKKTLEQDKNKKEVDQVIANYQTDTGAPPEPVPAPVTPNAPAESGTESENVDDIIAQFQKQEKKAAPQTLNNDDIDSFIAEYQNKE